MPGFSHFKLTPMAVYAIFKKNTGQEYMMCWIRALVACLILGAFSFATAGRVIRIGITEEPGNAYKDISGNYTGVTIEYLYKLSEYMGDKIELIPIRDAKTYFKSFDDGSVDALFDVIWTKEREKKYLFAKHESGYTPLVIYVRRDDERFEYGAFEQMKGITFGGEKGSQVTKSFIEWCKSQNFVPKIKYYSDCYTLNKGLDDYEIDAAVYGSAVGIYYRTIYQFANLPYYMVFNKDSTDLKRRIDAAMDLQLIDDPTYKQRLYDKYTIANYEIFEFSKAEKEYIRTHKKTRVAVIDNDAPYFYWGKDGTPRGIVPDYYARIAELSGLHFDFFAYKTQKEVEASVKDGRNDIIGLYSGNLVSAYMSGFRRTQTFAPANTVMFAPVDRKKSKTEKIAIRARSRASILDVIDSNLVGNLVEYNTIEDCFKAMNAGVVDAIVCDLPSVTWLLNQVNSAAYSIMPMNSLTTDVSSAVVQNEDVLSSILNKAIRASQYTYLGIITKNTLPSNSWRTFISRIPVAVILGFAIFMIVVVIVLILAIWTLIRHQRIAAVNAAVQTANEKKEAQIIAEQKSADEKNQFFSTISHDMRTPLNAIIGFSNLAKKEGVSPKVANYLTKIQRSGNLLCDLINDTLTLSKMGNGKLQLHLEPVSIKDLFEPILSPIDVAAKNKGISFTADSSGFADRVVSVDRLNLQKVILNLLTNAVKYTPAGGHIAFSATEENGNGGLDCTVTIKDDGIGMSKEFLSKIYTPFSQELRPGYEGLGTGLGLSIVKRLVDLMDGSIEVDSEINKGTTFILRFRFEEVENAREEQKQSESGKREFNGKKVLLFEDNDMNAEIARALLHEMGFTVVVAENGKLGVDMFARSGEKEFDAILMDLRMPVMDGYEATRLLLTMNREDVKTVPIIAMTADALDDDVRKCKAAGMIAHVTKPIDPGRLRQVLLTFVGRK
jgi:signal transduction histidine kinase/CheY-like chemotaxis protein